MPIADVISELDALRAAGLIADYAIGGAVAAHAYLEPTSTEDVDVFVALTGPYARSLAPFQAIYPFLIERGAKENGAYLEIGDWPVQFLVSDDPLHVAAVSGARAIPVAGKTARIMTPEYLAAIALHTGRAKDHIRLLAFLESGTIDRAQFGALVERFGLTPRWNAFQSRFLAEK